MSRVKVNIRPELVGKVFMATTGALYTLKDCGAEPTAIMEQVGNPDNKVTGPVSTFKEYVQLEPIKTRTRKPVVVAPARKPRGPNKKKGGVLVASLETDGEVEIHVPQSPDDHYTVTIKGNTGTGKTLQEAKVNAIDASPDGIYETLSEKGRKLLDFDK